MKSWMRTGKLVVLTAAAVGLVLMPVYDTAARGFGGFSRGGESQGNHLLPLRRQLLRAGLRQFRADLYAGATARQLNESQSPVPVMP